MVKIRILRKNKQNIQLVNFLAIGEALLDLDIRIMELLALRLFPKWQFPECYYPECVVTMNVA